MVKHNGTAEGIEEEKKFVREYNSNKGSTLFADYNKIFKDYNIDDIYMVRVSYCQYSNLSEAKVMTRADAYAIYSKNIKEIVKENQYYLDEELLDKAGISYKKIPLSGVSIKIASSSSYQILKLTPKSFEKMFGCTELGAGACLYCEKATELIKNKKLIDGWLSSEDKMQKQFKNIIMEEDKFHLNQSICKKIKAEAIKQIASIIDNNQTICEKIFNGNYLYEEPYTAQFLYSKVKLEKLKTIPYSITTGSGRSKGCYTLVLKPR